MHLHISRWFHMHISMRLFHHRVRYWASMWSAIIQHYIGVLVRLTGGSARFAHSSLTICHFPNTCSCVSTSGAILTISNMITIGNKIIIRNTITIIITIDSITIILQLNVCSYPYNWWKPGSSFCWTIWLGDLLCPRSDCLSSLIILKLQLLTPLL